jgi:hypothetical protein
MFNFMVGWHASAASLPLGDIILPQLFDLLVFFHEEVGAITDVEVSLV